MNLLLLSAAVLLCVVAFAHSYLGERYILIRLLRGSDITRLFGDTEFTKRTLRLAWHITSVLGVGLAALLAILASSPAGGVNRRMIEVIALTLGLSGLVALIGSRGRHLSWIAFFTAAILVWCGA